MIPRIIQSQLVEDMFQGKAVIVMGPRQVGKTTLLEMIRSGSKAKTMWLNCDEPDIRMLLENANSTRLRELIGDATLVFIDEAQRVRNIGITLKLMVDNLKNVQIVATGSSALELANEIKEPLTGRKWEYRLFPLSAMELVMHQGKLEESRLLEQRLVYGSYPGVINHPGKSMQSLLEISNDYLYKDLLSLENIRKPVLLEKILTALALQLGNEVSLLEVSRLVGADHKTVEHYVQLLEKCFVIFQLTAFSRNLRNEIRKSRKVYFYDNGIRNAIIKNFNPVGLRQDIGALWENYLISERMKFNAYSKRYVNSYFWRTHAQQEIDYIEESSGELLAVEFKWSDQAGKRWPESFEKAYPNTTYRLINRGNYMDFIAAG